MYEKRQGSFAPSPTVSHRNSRKLHTYLIKVKLYVFKRSVWSNKCYRERLQICTNINETVTFYHCYRTKPIE